MNGDRGEPMEALIEAAASPFRESDATGRVLPAAAWFDLAPAEREWLFDLQSESRLLERVLDPAGLSGTARAVVARVRGLRQLG
jgi:hypothetical protein